MDKLILQIILSIRQLQATEYSFSDPTERECSLGVLLKDVYS